MMRFKIFLFLVLLICSVDIGSATDYYISLSGDNTNNGTTLSSSWLTWAHATDTMVAGDTTWIVNGTYEETHVQFTNSGIEGNPIVLRAYNGTPSINGTRGSDERGLYISSKSWIEIYGLETYDFEKGLYIRQSDNISVYNHSSHDNGDTVPYGIIVTDGDYIHIENGTFFNGTHGIAAYDSNHVTVDNVQSYDNDMGGVYFNNTNNSIVENSHTWGITQDYGITVNYGDNIIFKNNIVNYSQNHGIGFQFGTSNSIIEYNVITDSEESIHVGDDDVLPIVNIADNNTVRHNIIYGITEEVNHSLYGITVKTGATNTTVYNNTIDNIGNVSDSASFYLSHAGINNNVYNNIILNNSYWAGAIRLLNSSNSTFTNNYVNADATWKYYLETSNYTEIYDEPQSIKLKFSDALSSGLIAYTDGSVFSASGTVDGDIPIRYNADGSSTLLLSGTAQTITSNISNQNIKIKATYDYIQDVIANVNNVISDIYNITLDSSVSENPCWINITVNKPSNTYKIERDGTYYDSVISDSNSIMRYNYDILGSEWSEHTFTITNANNEFVGTHTQTGTNIQNNVTNLDLIQDYNTSNINSIDCSFAPATNEPSKYNYIESLNPELWLPFDDNCNDLSINGNNGTAVGNPNFVNGNYNNGSAFNDSNYVKYTTINILNNTEYYISGIFRWDSVVPSTSNVIPFGTWNSTTARVYFYTGYTYTVRFSNPSGAYDFTGFDSSLLFDGEKHTILFNFDSENNVDLYVDNILVSSIYILNTSFETNAIGKGYTTDNYNWLGMIDNWIIGNQTLSESEHNNLYYDHLQQLQTKANSSTEYSTLWNSTADNPSSVPFEAGKILSYLEFSAPPLTIVDNVTIFGYNSTAQFIPSPTVVFTEPIVSFDSATNNIFTLNISHTSTLNATNGYIRYVTLNNSLLNAVWIGNATLSSDNPNATLVFDDESYFNITTGLLSNTDVFQYNITLPYIGISTQTIPANSWGMFNNWTSTMTFAVIAANESNDICYTYYNVTSGLWESYYVGYSWNADYTLSKDASVMGYFNAQTDITSNIITPSSTELYTGWNMLGIQSSSNQTISEIISDIGANCSDSWYFNSSTGSYSNTTTHSIQPNQGFLAYITQNMTWTRSAM